MLESELETFQRKCLCSVLELHPIRHDVVIAMSKRLGIERILNSNFYSVSFRVEDDAFVIPVAGSSRLAYYSGSFVGHLLGKAIHLFF